MGAMQSKSPSKIRDSSTQTPFLGCRYTKAAEPLARCSTLADICKPVPAASAAGCDAATRTANGTPLNKRPKYDPIYVLWKNSFEDQKTRTPRKVSPIRDQSKISHNIPDAVAGQLTPDGFPSYSELKPNESDSLAKEISSEDNKEKSASNVHRRLSLHKSSGNSMVKQEATTPSISDEEELEDYGAMLVKSWIESYTTDGSGYTEGHLVEAENSGSEESGYEEKASNLKNNSHSSDESRTNHSATATFEGDSPVFFRKLSYDMRRSYYYL